MGYRSLAGKMRAHAFVFFAVMACLAVVAFVVLRIEAFSNEIEERSRENRALACSTADLIAHVPAVQFEGEPLKNFLGWIEARAEILAAARAAQVCEPRIIHDLQLRIEKDDALLQQLNP